MRRKLRSWPKIQQRINSYVLGVSNSNRLINKLISSIGFKTKPLYHAKTEITDTEIKTTVLLKRGHLTFWIRPEFTGEKLVKLTIESKKNVAPPHILINLIRPMAKMLREETDVYIEQNITHP